MTKLKALSVEKIIKDEGADTAATKANVALVVAIWPNIFDIVAFLQLRSLYATAGMNDCLALVKTMVQKDPLLKDLEQELDPPCKFCNLFVDEVANLGLAISGACKDQWCSLMAKISKSAANLLKSEFREFKKKSLEEWEAFKKAEVSRFSRRTVLDLRKLVDPSSTETGEHCGEEGGEDQEPQKSGPLEQKIGSQSWNKAQLVDYLACQRVDSAKAAEVQLEKEWNLNWESMYRSLKSCAGSGLTSEQASAMDSAVESALAKTEPLEPNSRLSSKDIMKRVAATVPDHPATQALQAQALLQMSLLGGMHPFNDVGLDKVDVKVTGKPGQLKGSLIMSKDDFMAAQQDEGALKLFFAGRVALALGEVARDNPAKLRLMLDFDETEFNTTTGWVSLVTPLPGMQSLDSPLWKPAWNVPWFFCA